jgi:predicted MPP superfamily phosphohydrolase
MIIRFISDIHLDKSTKREILLFKEILKEILLKDADITIFCGDYFVGTTDDLMNFFDTIKKIAKRQVIFILGNHDILNKDFNILTKTLEKEFNDKVLFLENEIVKIKNCKIYGSIAFLNWTATKFTNFDYLKKTRREFKRVYDNGKLITPSWMKNYHEKCIEKIVNEECHVVATHFPLIKEPYLKIIDFNNPQNAFSTSDNSHILKYSSARKFINGHIHCSIKYSMNDKIFLSNPFKFS